MKNILQLGTRVLTPEERNTILLKVLRNKRSGKNNYELNKEMEASIEDIYENIYVMARFYQGYSYNQEVGDLVIAGVEGAIKAWGKWNPGYAAENPGKRSSSFYWYSSYSIRNAMIKCIADKANTNETFEKMKIFVLKIIERFVRINGREPLFVEIKNEYFQKYSNKITDKTLRKILNAENEFGSLSEYIVEEEKIVDTVSYDPVKEKNIEKVNFLYEKLNEKERKILKMYYFEGKTMLEIGKTMNISKQRIQQRISDILKKCKKLLVDYKE